MTMQPSNACKSLIEESEGERLQLYVDPAGIPTIGNGHKVLPGESFPSNGITPAEAQSLLAADMSFAAAVVNRLVMVTLTQGQFDALVDFVFNLGAARLAKSTLLADLNAGKYDDAASQILVWDHALANGREVELAGLKARREAEYLLWHS